MTKTSISNPIVTYDKCEARLWESRLVCFRGSRSHLMIIEQRVIPIVPPESRAAKKRGTFLVCLAKADGGCLLSLTFSNC